LPEHATKVNGDQRTPRRRQRSKKLQRRSCCGAARGGSGEAARSLVPGQCEGSNPYRLTTAAGAKCYARAPGLGT